METLVTSADGKVDVVEHLHNGGSGSGSETNDVVMSGVGGAGVGGIMGVPMFQTMDASFVPRIKRLMNQLNSAGVHAGLFLLNGDRPQVFASSNDMVRMFKSEEFNMVSQRHFGHLESLSSPVPKEHGSSDHQKEASRKRNELRRRVKELAQQKGVMFTDQLVDWPATLVVGEDKRIGTANTSKWGSRTDMQTVVFMLEKLDDKIVPSTSMHHTLQLGADDLDLQDHLDGPSVVDDDYSPITSHLLGGGVGGGGGGSSSSGIKRQRLSDD